MASPRETRRLGRYELVRELGRGGMGVVYDAVYRGPEGFTRRCVIKRLLPHLVSEKGFMESLVAEAKLSGLLLHPGIVQIHELGQVDGEYYVAMEYVDGIALIDVLRRCKRAHMSIAPGVVCHLGVALAEALAYAHALRDDEGRALHIVHRDVSPSNVVLGHTGAIKLLDFGIALAASHLRDETTKSGTLKGKLAYMSPEQADGLPIDQRSDLFALGVVCWEALTLRRLFRQPDDLATLRLVREARVEPTGIDAELDAVLLKLLARDREDRYASGEQVAAALLPIAQRLGGSTQALRRFLADVAALHPVDEPASTLAEPPTPSAPEGTVPTVAGHYDAASRPSPASGTRRWLAAAGVVALTIAGLVTLRPRPTESSRPDAARVVEEAPPVTQPSPTPPSPTPPSPTPPSPTPPQHEVAAHEPAAVPTTMHLGLRGTKGANVFLDGKEVGGLPMELELPRRAQPHKLVVARSGYRNAVRNVGGNVDVTLTINLVRATRSNEPTGDLQDPFAR